MKKTITKIAALFLALLIFQTNNVCAGNMRAMSSRIPAQKTITVVVPNIQTAKKLHLYLMSGASVALNIQNRSSANRIISTLQEKIKAVNKQGVIFQHGKGTKKGRYCIYNISKNDAKLYQYSVAFIEKLFNNYKNGRGIYGGRWYGTNNSTLNGWTEYRFYYEVYRCYKKSGSTLNFADYVSEPLQKYNNIRTQIESYYTRLEELESKTEWNVSDDEEYDECYRKIGILENEIEQLKKEKFWLDAVLSPFSKEVDIGQARMYAMVFSADSFSDLSDAMKVWMIASSGYFCGTRNRARETIVYNELSGEWDCSSQKEPCFCMVYKVGKYSSYKYDWQGMKNLLDNRASGVCAVFARYECLLFEQLGIKVYYNVSDKINHAWSVVKAKNSAGKTFWIPFDYGIGPAPKLRISDAITKKYLRTEEMRYRLYLNGIKGAPQKKNFTQNDFR